MLPKPYRLINPDSTLEKPLLYLGNNIAFLNRVRKENGLANAAVGYHKYRYVLVEWHHIMLTLVPLKLPRDVPVPYQHQQQLVLVVIHSPDFVNFL